MRGLIEFFKWRFCRRCGLLLDLLHSIAAFCARRLATVRNQGLARMQRHAVARPVNVVADAIRKKHGLRQGEADDARVVEVEAGIVCSDDRIPLCDALEVGGAPDAARHDRVRIGRPFGGRVENDFLLIGLQQTAAAGFGLAPIDRCGARYTKHTGTEVAEHSHRYPS